MDEIICNCDADCSPCDMHRICHMCEVEEKNITIGLLKAELKIMKERLEREHLLYAEGMKRSEDTIDEIERALKRAK